jgi:hypothetical protein
MHINPTKARRIAIALFQLSGVFYMTNCMGSGSGNSPTPGVPATILLTPQPISIAAGATVNFTANTTNASGYSPTWAFNYTPMIGTAGTLSAPAGTTVTYTAPSTPPIYVNGSFQKQGTVTLTASVENVAGCDDVTSSATFVITAPTVTVGLSPLTATVAVGQAVPTPQAFTGYAVGSTNSGLTWQVNGVTNGSLTYGTITTVDGVNVLYNPPVALPMTGNTVTITMISQADPTKTATATVTLH